MALDQNKITKFGTTNYTPRLLPKKVEKKPRNIFKRR